MHRDQDGWIKEFETRGAYWRHGGNPAMPHAELTAGDHSDGFFNGGVIARDPILLEQAAEDLVELMEQMGCRASVPDYVLGPAMGAITLAHDIARVIGKKRGWSCQTLFAEKGPTTPEGKKTMVFNRGSVKKGDFVLLAEDTWTTGSSLEAVEHTTVSLEAMVVPCRVLIMNRSGNTTSKGAKLVALINQKMSQWAPAECPLCKQGSKAIRPKSPASNWDLLTGKTK